MSLCSWLRLKGNLGLKPAPDSLESSRLAYLGTYGLGIGTYIGYFFIRTLILPIASRSNYFTYLIPFL